MQAAAFVSLVLVNTFGPALLRQCVLVDALLSYWPLLLLTDPTVS